MCIGKTLHSVIWVFTPPMAMPTYSIKPTKIKLTKKYNLVVSLKYVQLKVNEAFLVNEIPYDDQ